MPKSVEKAFIDVIGSIMGISNHSEDARATRFVTQMKKNKRY